MGVICFGSLKGGVGKTSLSVNVARAFAERDCEALLIDLDPMGHASRFVSSREVSRDTAVAKDKSTRERSAEKNEGESPLARLFLTSNLENNSDQLGGVVDAAITACITLIRPVQPHFAILPAGPELRHFLWGKGARLFKNFFPKLLEELKCNYDYIVIDTPPDFNVLTRNAIAAAELVVVPVDSSAMSIHCLEEIVSSAAHIKGPTWLIARSMVNRQASRVQKMSTSRLQEKLFLKSSSTIEEEAIEDEELTSPPDISNPEMFISLIEQREQAEKKPRLADDVGSGGMENRENPIFLLNSMVYRSEEQNKLTFLGKTAFDVRTSSALREQYLALAKELEQMLSFRSAGDPLLDSDAFQTAGLGLF